MTIEHVIEVATLGDPARVLSAALDRLRLEAGGVYQLTVAHDDGCPCLSGRPLPACTCEIIRLSRSQIR